MDTNTLTLFQDLVHWASLIILAIAVIVTLSGLYRPELFPNFFREFNQRKYIFSFGAFVVLLCGTVFIATQPNSKQTHSTPSQAQAITMAKPNTEQSKSENEGIKTEDIKVTEPIVFNKESRDDPTIEVGQTKIIQIGKNGEKTVIYQITYDKGQEISRIVKSQTVTTEPINEITAVGVQPQTLGANSNEPILGENQKADESARAEQSRLPSVRLSCKKNDLKRSSLLNICLHAEN